MESWSYLSEGKAFAFDDLIPPSNLLGRNKNPCMGWELKAPCGYEDNLIVPGQEGNGNQGFGDLGFPEMMLKRLPDEDLIRYDLGCKDGGGRMAEPVMPAPPVSSMHVPHASSGESSTSRLSGSVVESNNRESSFIDLKLGRFTDDRNARNCFGLSRAAPSLSPAESTTPTRRMRAVSLTQQNPFCQVLGCNKDLSSSKDYHKRHKVCEAHTKTAKVTVNGIEQRFCQQCSRFHLLVEFDNGKRSCRKRLAGHNERRRKPQAGNSHQNNRWLQPYNGNSINGSALLPGGLLHLKKFDAHLEKYEANRWYKRIRHDGDAASDNGRQLAITPANTLLHPKPNFLSFNFEKHISLFNDNRTNASTESIFSESNDYYPRNLRGPSSSSRSLSQNTSLERDDVAAFDTVSSFQGFSGIPGSGCVLSLLSSQAQDASIHSSGITLASPMMRPGNGSHSPYNVNQISGRLLEVSPRASTTMLLSNKFPSSGMSSVDGTHLSSVLISDVRGHDAGGFEDEDGVFQGLDFMNARGRFSCQDGATINLLELSSQLQRVEDQKQSMQMKQETDAFCGL